MEYKNIRVERIDGLAVVTIDRPDKLNALNDQTKTELESCFASLKSDGTVSAVVLTGAGEKSFVAGTDIDELLPLDAVTGEAFARRGQALYSSIENLGKPVIAAVNGYALGGGCELALACHIRIASRNAKFGQPEVNLGIMPGFGGTQRLPRVIGSSRALEMILTGNHINAEEALKTGLVSAVVAREELLPTAEKFARALLTKSRVVIAAVLEAVVRGGMTADGGGMELEARLFGWCCGAEDSTEGISAFLEKRQPVFRNR